MSKLPNEERIAALLGALGRDVSETVLADLPEDYSGRLRRLLDRFEESPLDEADFEDVLEEFTRFFRFAVTEAQADDEETGGRGRRRKQTAAPEEPPEPPPTQEPPPFSATDDAFADLERLQPFQIAGALNGESPRTIALVLNCLSPWRAGKALQELPDTVRGKVFMILRDSPQAPTSLLQRIVRTTVDKGSQLAMESIADPQEERNRRLAAVLRVMAQPERVQMLRMLEEQDEEVVTEIKKLLYTFEDLPRISDRTIQRILAETDSTTLATALKDADGGELEKVMQNLSRRARATLSEELEFLSQVKPEARQQARQAICDVMARLDQTGDLEMA